MNSSPLVSLPLQTTELLHQITGETEPIKALYSTLRDAIEHRLEKISQAVKELGKKYGLSFPQFKNDWNSGKIKQKHSYAVEKDYWQWEGLESRAKKLKSMLQWLP